MTAWIAITLCLVPLIGQVQGRPFNPCLLSPEDLGFQLLADVVCGDNINFTSPTNVMVECHRAAQLLFIDGFRKAHELCEGAKEHIEQTWEELDRVNATVCAPQTQAECTLTTTVHGNFADFVAATQEFAQKFNNAQAQRKTNQG